MWRRLSFGKKLKDDVDKLFSHGDVYAKYRPKYPPQLAQALAGLCGTPNLAWDTGTGNGQLAAKLAPHFKQVIGTDVNDKQIVNAVRTHNNVTYHVLPAEMTEQDMVLVGLRPGEVDLITVAQALHWFNFDEFHATVKQVIRPKGGVYAAITYDLPIISESVDELVRHYYSEVIGNYWDINRKWVEEHYSTIPLGDMAVHEVKDVQSILPTEAQCMTVEWNFQDLLGYLDSWSSTQTFVKKNGKHPLRDNPDLLNKFEQAWVKDGQTEKARKFRYPLFFRIART